MNSIKLTLKFLFFVFILNCTNTDGFCQDSLKRKNGVGIWLLPSDRANIYGIEIGLIGSETICNVPIIKKSHGINLQIFGQGFFIPINRKVYSFQNTMANDSSWMIENMDSVGYRAKHNGLLISGFGTLTEFSNGVVISGLSSLGFKVNGLAINLLSNKYVLAKGVLISLSNESHETKGVQIGFINRTNKLFGFQFGLWNVNSKRKMPIINWSF